MNTDIKIPDKLLANQSQQCIKISNPKLQGMQGPFNIYKNLDMPINIKARWEGEIPKL